MMKASSRRRWRVALIVAALFVFLVGVLAAAVDPIADSVTRRLLATQPGVRGDFDRVSFSPLSLRYRLAGLKLREAPDRGHPPLLFVNEMELRLHWKDLLRLHLVGDGEITHAKLTIVFDTNEEITRAIRAIENGELMASLHRRLMALPPATVDRFGVHDAEVLLVDKAEKEVPAASAEVWVHGAKVTLEGIATRPELEDSKPIEGRVTGTLQRSGGLDMHLKADPFGRGRELSARGSVRELSLRELYGFLAGPSGLQATAGTVDAFVEVEQKALAIAGQLKLVIDGLEVAAAKPSLGNKLKAAVANVVVGSPGKPVEVVIPITGRAADPKAAMQQTVMTAIRDAYLAPDGGH